MLAVMLILSLTGGGCALTNPAGRPLRIGLESDAVGVKKNGYNVVTAKLYTENGPVPWPTDALLTELEMSGIPHEPCRRV